MKTIYIIPGFGETCKEARYRNLSIALTKKGYKVVRVSPNWYRPLSTLIFAVKKNDSVVGFSFGAVIAYLMAKKYQFKKAILASLSPIRKFSFQSMVKEYGEHMADEKAILNARDVKRIKLSFRRLRTPFVTLAGEREKGIKADILVPRTGHFLTKQYIKCICELL